MIRAMKALTRDQAQGIMYSSWLSGFIDTSFSELVDLLGQPTYDGSMLDNKINCMWLIRHKNNYFTIYDWKTHIAHTLSAKSYRFHVGGIIGTEDFISLLKVYLNLQKKRSELKQAKNKSRGLLSSSPNKDYLRNIEHHIKIYEEEAIKLESF